MNVETGEEPHLIIFDDIHINKELSTITFIVIVADRFIFKNYQITFFPCFTYPKKVWHYLNQGLGERYTNKNFLLDKNFLEIVRRIFYFSQEK